MFSLKEVRRGCRIEGAVPRPCLPDLLAMGQSLTTLCLVQLEGAFPDTMTKCAELLNRTIDVDFVDINVGCPIDLVYKKVKATLLWSLGRVWPKPGTLPC